MKSIQSKILLVVIAGLLVITAVVSVVAVTMTHEVMHRDADRILKNAAEREAAKINDVLGDVVKSTDIMEHYATVELEQAERLRDVSFRAEYLQKAERMFTEIASNTTGIQGFFMRIDPAYADGTTGFYKTLADDETFKDMPLTDLRQYREDDEQNVGWYYSAARQRGGVWLAPYTFPGVPTQLISFVCSLYVEDTLVGVVGFDMDFEYLVKRINEIAVYEDGYALLLAADRATPYNGERAPNREGGESTDTIVELKNGMFLELRAEYQDIQRDIRPMLRNIVLVFVAVLVCAVIYTVIVTRQIVRPLKQLTAAAKHISDGVEDADLSDLPMDAGDEIGTLSVVLSDTYVKIQEYTSYINALAHRDSLTGINNRTAYAEAVAELNRDIRAGTAAFGVLVADVNNLKQANDRHGHEAGNHLIISAANVLAETFGRSSVFRIGGDEFVVLLRDGDYAQYRERIERMDAICANERVMASDTAIPVSIARGVSLYDPETDHAYEDVFERADHAMYVHKQQSKAITTI